jgi:hypothetical protein
MRAGAEKRLRELVALHTGEDPGRVRVVEDTTDFFRVDYGDVLLLEDRAFLIKSIEREGRFGLDEEPKYWVRRAIDLDGGGVKVVKMSFREHFTATYGGMEYECVRSPEKEAEVLDLVRGHPRYMQGEGFRDAGGNTVRVLDFIRGETLAAKIEDSAKDHEQYYHESFPAILEEFVELAGAVGFLHGHGFTHGDIRRDHLIVERETGKAVWIDFDFSCFHRENRFGYDLAGLGNVFLFLAGGGDVTVQGLKKAGSPVYPLLEPGDLNMLFRYRVANLSKVYPYIHEQLSYVLGHFAAGAEVFYETTEALLDDLEEVRAEMG